MEVQFSPELEAKLADAAAQQGRHPGELVQEMVARCLDEDARFVQAVKHGEAALDRGDSLTHEELGQRLQRFLHT